MFAGCGFGTFVKASRLLGRLFFVTDLKELSQLLARRLDLLGLQSGLDYVEGVGDEASEAASDSRTEEVPEVRIRFVPGPEVSLEVLIHADHGRGERYVHHDGDRVRPEQGLNALFLDDRSHTLGRREVGAEL